MYGKVGEYETHIGEEIRHGINRGLPFHSIGSCTWTRPSARAVHVQKYCYGNAPTHQISSELCKHRSIKRRAKVAEQGQHTSKLYIGGT